MNYETVETEWMWKWVAGHDTNDLVNCPETLRKSSLVYHKSQDIIDYVRTWLGVIYARSPRILLANWMSLGMIVTLLAWIAHKLVSSKSPTK